MKKEEVPQDNGYLVKGSFRELCYAVDKDGNYVTEHTTGWTPKTIALSNAIDEINERVEKAKQKVLANQSSPIEYFMEVNKMDVSILASYVGMWNWQVKRHFKPLVFKKLKLKTLQKYAEVFEITTEELTQMAY
ncbi:MAG: hypothetical protein R2776_01065 [Flavobacteriaceae bacterium]|nr:hypothetical protein [Flavobacteriaceae bacterium]